MKSKAFAHNIATVTWTIWDTIIPPNSDDTVTIISTVWNNVDKDGETIYMKLKTKTYFEFKDSMVSQRHKTEQDAREFHDKILKEALDG